VKRGTPARLDKVDWLRLAQSPRVMSAGWARAIPGRRNETTDPLEIEAAIRGVIVLAALVSVFSAEA
jgi:hypothetical protein